MLATTIVVGILLYTAVFGWALLRVSKTVERAENEPRYRRRLLKIGAGLYLANIVYLIAEVAVGDLSVQSLVGLPVSFLIVWLLFRAARAVKVPPA